MSPPLNDQSFFLRACEYITIHGKKDFADVIKLRILRWEMSLHFPGGPSKIMKLF